MKAFLAIISVFIVVIALVYQTGYQSHHQAQKQLEAAEPAKQDVIIEPVVAVAEPASQIEHGEPAEEDPETQEEEPDKVQVVYIEKTYVKEVYHTERVVYREPEQHDYRRTSYGEADNCCSDFTGSARTKCYRYIEAGYTCPQFEATISYAYQPNNTWR